MKRTILGVLCGALLLVGSPALAEVECFTAYRMALFPMGDGTCVYQMQMTKEWGCSDSPRWVDWGSGEVVDCEIGGVLQSGRVIVLGPVKVDSKGNGQTLDIELH